MTLAPAHLPLVSILCIVKNGVSTIRRCIESILAQDYPCVEIIVQDGASTDGTLEILGDYPDRISLVSEPDRCGEEGLFRALRRATGEIIGFCLDDEELYPHAASWAADKFITHQDIGAFFGEQDVTTLDGKLLHRNFRRPFDFAEFICFRNYPPMGSSFFNRSALESIGLHHRAWRLDCGNMELWLELGQKFKIAHFPEVIAKYSLGPHEMSMSHTFISNLMGGTQRLMDDFFSRPALSPQFTCLMNESLGNHKLNFAEQFIDSDIQHQEFKSSSKIIDLMNDSLRFQPEQSELKRISYRLLEYSCRLFEIGLLSETENCINFVITSRLLESERNRLSNLLQAISSHDSAKFYTLIAILYWHSNESNRTHQFLERSLHYSSNDLCYLRDAIYIFEKIGRPEIAEVFSERYRDSKLQQNRYAITQVTAMITILIPTYNRPLFLKRALAYYAWIGFDGFISIGDSSNEENALKNQKAILAHSKKLNIIYQHFSKTPPRPDLGSRWSFTDESGTTYRDGGIVLAELGRRAVTPYVVFSGDDDFLVPNSLNKCIQFLENNSDHSAAHGLRIHFRLSADGARRHIVNTQYVPEHVLKMDDAGDRWSSYLRHAYSTQFYVHRRETWSRMYAGILDVPEHYMGAEVLPCSMTCILGKVAQVDCLMTLFQENYGYEKTFSWQTHSIYSLMLEPYWYSSVQGLRMNLEPALVVANTNTPVRQLFDREFGHHIASFLEWQYQARYGEWKHVDVTLDSPPFSLSYGVLTSPRWYGLISVYRQKSIQSLMLEKGYDETRAVELVDQIIWLNLALNIRREYLQTHGDCLECAAQQSEMLRRNSSHYSPMLSLESLSTASSPYYGDFLPVIQFFGNFTD